MPRKPRNNQLPLKIRNALKKVPKGLPFFLQALTSAAHIFLTDQDEVKEQSLTEDGFTACALIFAPIYVCDDENNEYDGQLNIMYEVRANILMSMQDIANECGVDYRTIQRWRDQGEIVPVQFGDKQLFPDGIVKDVARKKGHIKHYQRWR